ncbi:transketolase family protein [Helicobacter sp.]|uniref:transketolase family protein n=1 Tax=Helicobacter sp. TaxID=218 RepID=UPI0025BA78B7|nr:transketolase [Helicobacter sp.]MCI5968191.1 transketolase [Helicobacter sp.]MDY2584999.1 transketolase [Helicobacter sp.]
MRNTLAQCIYEVAKANKDFVLITGDAGLGVWDSYKEEFREQYFNPGINEALCVGMASGMALCGKKVVYYNIAPFVLMRPYEQVRNDICYQNVPVILAGTGSGITYMPSGMTHYAIEDIALGLTMPNLEIFSPCDPVEARACFAYAYASKNPSYIRIPKAGEPNLHTAEIVDITAPQMLREGGNSVLFITHSAIAAEVLEVASVVNASVMSVPFINSKNGEILKRIPTFDRVIVVEEHFKYGGLGTYLQSQVDKKIEILGIENAYVHFIGTQAQAREHYGINAKGILNFIKGL